MHLKVRDWETDYSDTLCIQCIVNVAYMYAILWKTKIYAFHVTLTFPSRLLAVYRAGDIVQDDMMDLF